MRYLEESCDSSCKTDSVDSASTCTYVHSTIFSTHTCSFPRSVGDNEAVRVAPLQREQLRKFQGAYGGVPK